MKKRNINTCILGETWTIHIVRKFPKRLAHNEGTAAALCVPTDKAIYIKTIEKADCKDVQRLFNTILRHEIVHAYLIESGLNENANAVENWATNEEMVDWFALQSEKIFKTYKELNII